MLVTLFHEMWRDELQAWNIARESSTLAQLFRNSRYETHPPLWHLCLFVLTRFTSNPLAMQLLHVALATAAAYVFLRYAPLSRLQRGLFVFGFFPFYEYGAVVRCYSLGLLFAFAFCALFAQRERRLLWMSVMLFGMSMSSAYGLILALSLAAALVAAWVIDKRDGRIWQAPGWQVLASGLMVLAGVAIAAIRIHPPSDSDYATGLMVERGFSMDRVLYALAQVPHALNPGCERVR